MVKQSLLRRLTVWRRIDLTIVGQEGVAFTLALELGGELLGGDSGEGDRPLQISVDRLIFLLHKRYQLVIIELVLIRAKISLDRS